MTLFSVRLISGATEGNETVSNDYKKFLKNEQVRINNGYIRAKQVASSDEIPNFCVREQIAAAGLEPATPGL